MINYMLTGLLSLSLIVVIFLYLNNISLKRAYRRDIQALDLLYNQNSVLIDKFFRLIQIIPIDKAGEETTKIIETLQNTGKEEQINIICSAIDMVIEIYANSNDGYEKENKIEASIYKELKFYSSTVKNLINSINKNISISSEPISNEILLIKRNITDFLYKTGEIESEIIEKNTIDSIILKEEELFKHIEKLLINITENFVFFKTATNDLKNVIESIYNSANNISSIADKVGLLSINTSIEAARAGSNGTGFKIIATEIRKLSTYAQNLVKEIKSTILVSKKIFSDLSEKVDFNQKSILEQIDKEKEYFSNFKSLLLTYFTKFKILNENTRLYIDKLNSNVLKINPIIQLYEITIQEIENLNLVLKDFFEKNINLLKTKITDNDELEIDEIVGNKFVSAIRNRLTTSREFDSIFLTLKEFHIENKITFNTNDKDIEFF